MSNEQTGTNEPLAAEARRPFIVGAPRTGYGLLTIIVDALAPGRGSMPITPQVKALGSAIATAITVPFGENFGADRVLFNPNFQYIFGGPRYVDHGTNRLRIRKYLGVIDAGDIIININLPLMLLNYFPLIHLHHASDDLLGQIKHQVTLFQTIRNPAGILNSACHSLNALTSEYLQRTKPTLHQQDIRTEVAFSKMTSPDIFASLCRFYTKNLESYSHIGTANLVRWEDTIDRSLSVLENVSKVLHTSHDQNQLQTLWQRMDHRNLTGSHKHNFREGFGLVGDWKNWLVPPHLEIMRSAGLEPVFDKLGYDFPTVSDLEPFNSWQRKCLYSLEKGLSYTPVLDQNLRGFSENKSNADVERPTVRGTNVSIEVCGLDAPDVINQVVEGLDAAIDAATTS